MDYAIPRFKECGITTPERLITLELQVRTAELLKHFPHSWQLNQLDGTVDPNAS